MNREDKPLNWKILALRALPVALAVVAIAILFLTPYPGGRCDY